MNIPIRFRKAMTYLKLVISLILFFLTFGQFCIAQNLTVDNYPTKPIKWIVPFGPASASDILARTIGEKLQSVLGQTIIVENKPGAGGTIATAQVAKAEPDGYTMIVVSAGHVVNPAMYKNLSYDTLKDFSGVIPLASLPSVLVVNGQSSQNNVNDLVSLIKSKQGQINFVSGGVGSASHMNAEKFLLAINAKAFHIPLKGASDMAVEIIAGRSEFGFMPLIAAMSFIKDGRLKPLAVSSPQRSASLINVPTMSEAGYPGGEFNFWIGLLAPSKTPSKTVKKINLEITKIMNDPELKTKYLQLGAQTMILTPEKYDQFMEEELKNLGDIIQKANVKLN